MKKLLSLIVIMMIMQSTWAADTVTVCRRTDVEWLSYQFDGIDFTAETFGYVALGASQLDDDTLIADGLIEDNGDGYIFSGQAYVFWYGDNGVPVEIWGTPETPPCGYGWQPDAPSISIPAPGPGPYLLEIQDAYGNWSLVRDDAHPDGIVLYNNGGAVELIGSAGQDTDPAHYRLVDPNAE